MRSPRAFLYAATVALVSSATAGPQKPLILHLSEGRSIIAINQDGKVFLNGKRASCDEINAYFQSLSPKDESGRTRPLYSCGKNDKLPHRAIWPILIEPNGNLICSDGGYTLRDKKLFRADLQRFRSNEPTGVISLHVAKGTSYKIVSEYVSIIQQSGVKIDATADILPESNPSAK